MRFALLLAVAGLSCVSGLSQQHVPSLASGCPAYPRPDYTDHARLARWLVHQLDWGVVSTTSRHLGGTAFGNPLSVADGPCGSPTGRLLFNLSPMDATMQDLSANANASLALHEAQLAGACRGLDPEDPRCAKLLLSGALLPVPPEAQDEARQLLFARHPAMRGWPAGHEFTLHELRISALRLLDHFGGAHDLSPEEYAAAQP